MFPIYFVHETFPAFSDFIENCSGHTRVTMEISVLPACLFIFKFMMIERRCKKIEVHINLHLYLSLHKIILKIYTE